MLGAQVMIKYSELTSWVELRKRWLLGEWSLDTSSIKWKGLLQRFEVILV